MHFTIAAAYSRRQEWAGECCRGRVHVIEAGYLNLLGTRYRFSVQRWFCLGNWFAPNPKTNSEKQSVHTMESVGVRRM